MNFTTTKSIIAASTLLGSLALAANAKQTVRQ